MQWSRIEVKERAKQQIGKNYWRYFLASFLFILVSGGIGGFSGWRSDVDQMTNAGGGDWLWLGIFSGILAFASVISLLLTAFVGGPLEVGIRRFYLRGIQGEPAMDLLGSGLRKEEYWSQVKTLFVPKIFIFLWSLLLIIPGIIKSYEYRFVSYIAAEHPGISYQEAIAASRAMTNGQKWNMFVLDLSFLGWLLLGSLCCGFGVIFVQPYIDATFVQLYDTLKGPQQIID